MFIIGCGFSLQVKFTMRLLFFAICETVKLGVYFQIVEGLDYELIHSVINQDCSQYYIGFEHGNKSMMKCFVGYEHRVELRCPPWFIRNGERGCALRKDFHGLVQWVPGTLQLWLQNSYCMTTSNATSINRTDMIGSCLYSTFPLTDLTPIYYPLPCNISELNSYTCAGLNREGQLCGRCVDGYAPPVYSYSLSCVNCTEYHLNWLKYIGAGFGPLTIFCLLVCVFHISAMSPYLFGFVFYCQIMTMPIVMRIMHLTQVYAGNHLTIVGENIYASFFSIWNLDWLRSFYEPFCLHPNMTFVQAITLDYLVAIYPLLLLLIALTLVSLHSKDVKLINAVWKPFKMVTRPFFRNLNIQTSLIESFATLYFLSAMKVQSVTLDLLSPTAIYHTDGIVTDKLYLLLAGEVEYFGKDHLPYALLALFFFTLFFLLPVLLLFLYPCQCFQRLLNKTNCNFIALRIFIDTFQGNYKDGTNNTRDYRFFAGIFFLTRFILVAAFVFISSMLAFVAIGIITTLLAFSVAILHPQKTKVHYIIDCLMLMILSMSIFSIIATNYNLRSFVSFGAVQTFSILVLISPIIYISCIVCYWIIGKARIPQRLVHFVVNKVASTSLNEQQSLIQCTQ